MSHSETLPKPLLIGLTGGIASGKSLIAKIFHVLGIPAYEADQRAKWLMQHDPELKEGIVETFGAASYTSEGELDRRYLAAQVFNQEDRVKQLNALVHPRVGQDFVEWVGTHKAYPYLLNEAALMFESGRFKSLDHVITVYAPENVRVTRVQKRDPQRSLEEIKAIMSKQMPEEEKLKRADFVVYNDGSRLVIQQVLDLHQKFLSLKRA